MNIAIIGQGLIGGSIAKGIKKYTNHKVYGLDKDKNVIIQSIKEGVIDKKLKNKDYKKIDLIIIALYLKDTIEFIKENKDKIKKGTIVTDVCGLKEEITIRCEKDLTERGINYIGLHPMAGTEKSGYKNSTHKMFKGSSLIITITKNTNKKSIKKIEKLAKEIQFKQVIKTNAKTHDKIIAFTSQLAHIVSNAYIKSKTALYKTGFTGGSFQDLTRVAMLNSKMWSELFITNRDNLKKELKFLIENLNSYYIAIDSSNQKSLYNLLKTGSKIKENINKKERDNNEKNTDISVNTIG